jgi:hypothetical protein
VSEKLIETKHFRAPLYAEEPELAPPGPPESFGMEKIRLDAQSTPGQDGKMEIPAEST